MPDHHGNSCLQIFEEVENGLMQFQGSGVLIRRNERHWFITAVHVLCEINKRRYFYRGNDGIVGFDATQLYSTCAPNPEGIAKDSKDLGVVRITDEMASAIQAGGHLFYDAPNENVSRGHSDFGEARCTFYGFPGALTQVILAEKPTIASTCLIYESTLLSEQLLRLMKIDPAFHVALQWETKPKAPADRAPNPEGMSGGGIWVNEGNGSKLVAIATEYDRKKRFVLGTRVYGILALIDHLNGVSP